MQISENHNPIQFNTVLEIFLYKGLSHMHAT